MNSWFPLTVGNLDAYSEPGSTGIRWAIHDNSLPGYNGLFFLLPGDYLRVFGAGGACVWEGVIEFDYRRDWRPYGHQDLPIYGEQVLMGQRVQGLPDDGLNIRLDDWWHWFDRRASAVVWRDAGRIDSQEISPLVLAIARENPDRWPWMAPTRLLDGLSLVNPMDRARILGDIPPAVAWIAHHLKWSVTDVATSLEIPEALAQQWSAPSDLPWHRALPSDPAWFERAAFLPALFAHMHFQLGERLRQPDQWGDEVSTAIRAASTSFAALQRIVMEWAPDPDAIKLPRDAVPPAALDVLA